MSLLEEAVAQLATLERGIAACEVKERPLVLRGWRDDFMGQVLHEQYDQRTVGALSSLVLQPNAHGGVLRLTAGNVAADYARIMLGDRAYAFNTLDADDSWCMIGRYKLSHTTSILVDMFAGAPVNQHIHITADTAQGPNWYLRTFDGVGVDTFTDSGVAIDTAWHVHRLEVTSGRAEHWMDGERINYTTAKIPTIPQTGNVRCLARAAVSRYADLDYWIVEPRNL